jgi:hypothetical protein
MRACRSADVSSELDNHSSGRQPAAAVSVVRWPPEHPYRDSLGSTLEAEFSILPGVRSIAGVSRIDFQPAIGPGFGGQGWRTTAARHCLRGFRCDFI